MELSDVVKGIINENSGGNWFTKWRRRGAVKEEIRTRLDSSYDLRHRDHHFIILEEGVAYISRAGNVTAYQEKIFTEDNEGNPGIKEDLTNPGSPDVHLRRYIERGEEVHMIYKTSKIRTGQIGERKE